MIIPAGFVMLLLLVAGPAEVVVSPVWAQGAVDAKAALDCRGWTTRPLAQTEMNICSTREVEAQRSKLERLVGDLREKLAVKQPSQWATLSANQKSWRDFVENDCEWEAAFSDGGSIQPLARNQCLAAATAQRINRLRVVLCEGEGATGECPESKKYE